MTQTKKSTLPALVQQQDDVRERLSAIDAAGETGDGTRAHIVLGDGRYLSGYPYFGSSDFNRAFTFRDKQQAQELIDAFPLALDGAVARTVFP